MTNYRGRNGGTDVERSFETVLVEQCRAHTGRDQAASLFRWQGADRRQSREAAARWARELAPYGNHRPGPEMLFRRRVLV